MTGRCKQIIDWMQRTPAGFWLIAILLLSLTLKLLCRYFEPTVSRDGCLYLRLIQAWYDTGNFQGLLKDFPGMWLPPLPLYLMKCLMELGLSAEAAGVALNIALGTFTPLWTYGIAWEITQKRHVALCAALLAAVNPSLNELAIQVQRDMIYLSLIGAALWLIAAGIRRERWWLWPGAGLLCGCAMLTRFETLEMVALVPAALLFLCCAGYLTWKRGSLYGTLFLLCFAGSVWLLSALMQTQDYLFKNYEQYYQGKFDGVKKKFEQK